MQERESLALRICAQNKNLFSVVVGEKTAKKKTKRDAKNWMRARSVFEMQLQRRDDVSNWIFLNLICQNKKEKSKTPNKIEKIQPKKKQPFQSVIFLVYDLRVKIYAYCAMRFAVSFSCVRQHFDTANVYALCCTNPWLVICVIRVMCLFVHPTHTHTTNQHTHTALRATTCIMPGLMKSTDAIACLS